MLSSKSEVNRSIKLEDTGGCRQEEVPQDFKAALEVIQAKARQGYRKMAMVVSGSLSS